MTIKEEPLEDVGLDEEIVVEGESDQKAAAKPNEADTTTDDNKREFPDVFYDPLHPDNIMKDPVVNPDGDSYERSTLEDEASTTYYPNRALQTIIQREVELADSSSLRGGLRRIDESVKGMWNNLLEKSVFAVEHKPLPESYYCVITGELMTDPVVTKEGNTFEREAIQAWIRKNGESPLTRTPLTLRDLRPNNALYELIQREKRPSLESMHPSIRRWKESGANTSQRQFPTEEDLEASAPPASQDAPPVVAGTPVAGTPPPASYPLTPEELRARRRTRVQCRVFTCVAILATVALIVFVPGAAGFAFFIVLAFVIFFSVSTCVARRHARFS